MVLIIIETPGGTVKTGRWGLIARLPAPAPLELPGIVEAITVAMADPPENGGAPVA
jgi:hypothetical protein